MSADVLGPGTLVAGRFEIDRFISSGGMGVVYRARDLHARLGAPGAARPLPFVALKLLRPDTLGQIGIERFVREARLLSQLHHAGIVSYIADGTTDTGQCYLAMEWLEGIDLGQRLRKGALSLPESLLLLERMASILSATHARGIIHRDLKPSNLFLHQGALERLKVLDFGVARVADVHGGTQTGLIVGTPAYMAPEQARGLREITPAADIYSLGCILYECLSGRPPFPVDQPAATLVRVLFEEPRPLETLCQGLPASLLDLQRRMMAKVAAGRLQNGQALYEALRDLAGQSDMRGAQIAIVQPPAEITDGGWLSRSSQSLLSVVLAAPQPASEAGAGERLASREQERLLEALQQLGASVECLSNGSLLVTVGEVGSAVEQVSLAARAALLIKRRWPEAVVALATGRGQWQGQETVGTVVNRATYLSLQAPAGWAAMASVPYVICDEVSAHLLEGRFQLAELPTQKCRVLLCELERPQPIRQVFGGPTPLCGREVELNFLERQLASCAEDHKAQVVLLTAVPGVGKTRLLYEFLARVKRRTNPVRTYSSAGSLRSAGVPYTLVRKLLRAAYGLPPELEPVSDNDQTLADQPSAVASSSHLPLPLPQNRRLLPGDQPFVRIFLAELCGANAEGEMGEDAPRLRQLLYAARKEPRLMHQHLRRAFVTWLGSECQQSPVLITLDDLHWGDALSVSLIDDALRELRSAPLLVLSMGRPEIKLAFPKLWAGQPVHELSLKPLGRKSCERMVRLVREAEPAADDVARWVELSAGNPFYLEELLRGTSESTDGKTSGVATIVAMLQARICRLEVFSQRILLAASIFGSTFSRGGLAALLGSTIVERQLDDALQALIQSEIIEPRPGRYADREFVFRHGLMRDAAYELLTGQERLHGHRLAARVLERLPPSEVRRIAEHWQQGCEPERASRAYLQAGVQAARRGSGLSALQCYQQALRQIENLPGSPALRRLQVDILLPMVQLSPCAEPLSESMARLDKAQNLLLGLEDENEAESGDELRRSWLELLCSRICLAEGRVSESLLYCSRVLAAADRIGDAALCAAACQCHGFALTMQGRFSDSEPLLRRALALESHLNNAIERLIVHGCVALQTVATGGYDAGMAQHQHVATMAAAECGIWGSTLAELLHCVSLAQCGDVAVLEERAQALQVQIRQPGLESFRFAVHSLLSWAHVLQGDLAQAQIDREAAEASAGEGSPRLLFADWLEAIAAEQLLCQGEVAAALQFVERKTPKWRLEQQALAAALGEQVWGLALSCRSPENHAEADEHLASALAIMQGSGQVMASVRLRLLWAHLFMRRDTPEQAKILRAEATAQLAAAGALHLLSEVESSCMLLPYGAASDSERSWPPR